MTRDIERKIVYSEKLIKDFTGFKGNKFIKEIARKEGSEVVMITDEGTIFLMGNIKEEFIDYVINRLNKFLKSLK